MHSLRCKHTVNNNLAHRLPMTKYLVSCILYLISYIFSLGVFMKFIHLSDLHIGKRVYEVSMLEEQQHILASILQLIRDEKPRAVVIAGDVYDKSVPPAEAMTLFDDFLFELCKLDIQVLIISGNHDSPERLAFGGRLMQRSGIHVSPVYSGKVEPVTIVDEDGPVNFWLLPFLKPIHVRRFFPEAEIESYTDACRVAVEQMDLTAAPRNVLITHQFVTGSATCESEELSVGGSDQVDGAVFADFDYVALGHLHGPQNVHSNRMRYCGTPLKYSFSEVHHHKSVTVVELAGDGSITLRALPLTPLHDLSVLKGTFRELTDKDFYDTAPVEDYLHITLTDEEDVPEAVGRLRQIYPNLLQLSYDNTRTRTTRQVEGARDVKSKSPLELFGELYQQQNNQPMSEEQQRFLQQWIGKIWEEGL